MGSVLIAFRAFDKSEDDQWIDCVVEIDEATISRIRMAVTSLAACGGVSMNLPVVEVLAIRPKKPIEYRINRYGYTERASRGLRFNTPEPIVVEVDNDFTYSEDEFVFEIEELHVGNDGSVWIDLVVDDDPMFDCDGFLGMIDALAAAVGA